MKDLLLSFILALVLGAVINGFNQPPGQVPAPTATAEPSPEATGAAGSHILVELNTSNFQSEVLSCDQPVFVDFYAPSSKSSESVASLINGFASQYANKIKFGQVNTDNNAELSSRYDITSLPTFAIFKNGKPVVFLRDTDKEALAQILDRYAQPSPSTASSQ